MWWRASMFNYIYAKQEAQWFELMSKGKYKIQTRINDDDINFIVTLADKSVFITTTLKNLDDQIEKFQRNRDFKIELNKFLDNNQGETT